MNDRARTPSEIYDDRQRRRLAAHKNTPAPERTPGLLPDLPARPVPDDGARVCPSAVEALKRRYEALELTDEIDTVTREARAAGYGLSLRQNEGVRRFDIGRALITLGEAHRWDDELIRCFAAAATGDTACQQPGIPLGAVLGAMTAAEAATFADLADRFLAGTVPLMVTISGPLYIPDNEIPFRPQTTEDDPFGYSVADHYAATQPVDDDPFAP